MNVPLTEHVYLDPSSNEVIIATTRTKLRVTPAGEVIAQCLDITDQISKRRIRRLLKRAIVEIESSLQFRRKSLHHEMSIAKEYEEAMKTFYKEELDAVATLAGIETVQETTGRYTIGLEIWGLPSIAPPTAVCGAIIDNHFATVAEFYVVIQQGNARVEGVPPDLKEITEKLVNENMPLIMKGLREAADVAKSNLKFTKARIVELLATKKTIKRALEKGGSNLGVVPRHNRNHRPKPRAGLV